MKRICPYCGMVFEGSGRSFSNHVRWCKMNPLRKHLDGSTSQKISSAMKNHMDEKWGKITKHQVMCANCGKIFEIEEREKKFDPNRKYYCCKSCANTRKPSEETKEKIRKSVNNTIQENIQNGIFQKLPTHKNFKFNESWHTTWNGQNVYLRSQLEILYAIELDKKQILYEVESLRIVYYDSRLQKRRYSIPDFLLVESNTIVEIKSSFTYDPINMKDKCSSYLNLGYKVQLILDGEQFIINNGDDLPPQKQSFLIHNLTDQYKDKL